MSSRNHTVLYLAMGAGLLVLGGSAVLALCSAEMPIPASAAAHTDAPADDGDAPQPGAHGSGASTDGSNHRPPGRTRITEPPNSDPGFLGVVMASQTVDVAARLQGRIKHVRVRLGDRVARGDILATLDHAMLQSELASARASLQAARARAREAALALEEARARHGRWRASAAMNAGAVSVDEMADIEYQARSAAVRADAARASVAEQQARVAGLVQQIEDATVRAPFDARVAVRHVDAGATVMPGTPIARLVGASDLRVRFAVPEERGTEVAVGQQVEARLETMDLRLSGVIEKIAPEVDTASRMIFAEARVSLSQAQAEVALAGRTARVHTQPASH